jgi:hypothetical protein
LKEKSIAPQSDSIMKPLLSLVCAVLFSVAPIHFVIAAPTPGPTPAPTPAPTPGPTPAQPTPAQPTLAPTPTPKKIGRLFEAILSLFEAILSLFKKK